MSYCVSATCQMFNLILLETEYSGSKPKSFRALSILTKVSVPRNPAFQWDIWIEPGCQCFGGNTCGVVTVINPQMGGFLHNLPGILFQSPVLNPVHQYLPRSYCIRTSHVRKEVRASVANFHGSQTPVLRATGRVGSMIPCTTSARSVIVHIDQILVLLSGCCSELLHTFHPFFGHFIHTG